MLNKTENDQIRAVLNKWSTTNFNFLGVNWWPLIKTHVNLRYFHEKRDNFPGNTIKDDQSEKIDIPKIGIRTFLSLIKLLVTTRKRKVSNAIFTYDTNKTTVHNGEKINQYTQPFIDYFIENNIDFDLYDVQKTWLNPINIHPLFAFYRKEVTKSFNKDESFRALLINFTDSLKREINPNFDLYKFLAHSIINSQATYLAYLWCFKKARYKNILFYCYYCGNIMAINRAAKKRKIKTIEYQHSQVSKEHVAYSGWANMREDHFFPSVMWAWSDTDARSLSREFSFTPGFKAIVGGNIYVPWYLKSNLIKNTPSNNSTTKILYTLQGIGIPSFIFDYIANCENMIWFIREHPRQPVEKETLEKLKAVNPKWVNIKYANADPLFKLLAEVDYHITSYSGTAIEAQIFNVQNIIFSEKGYNSYQEQIEGNQFLFIRNEKDLDNILKNRIVKPGKTNDILTDHKIITKNIINLFS